jgi:hypothetical protein
MNVALNTIKQTNKQTNKPFSTIFRMEFGTVMYLLLDALRKKEKFENTKICFMTMLCHFAR